MLAEYLVGKALGVASELRIAWDAYDIFYKGIKIEVKSSSYIQAWYQKDHSAINFGIAKTKGWCEETNLQEKEKKRQADIYVFCLLNHKIQETLDPMNLKQWEFYILPTFVLNEKYDHKNISLKKVKELKAIKSNYNDLKTKIEMCILNMTQKADKDADNEIH